MTTKMLSPKIEIINYFDELINKVDIDIEKTLSNYNEQQIMGRSECFKIEKRKTKIHYNTNVNIFESSQNDEFQTVELWSKSTKVVDYLNQVRMRTIEELRKAQKESLEYYKLNSTRFKEMLDETKKSELRSQLFAEKFYFQIRLTNEVYKPFIFKLFTIVTDFYMSPSDIEILNMVINEHNFIIEPFFRVIKQVFDEKMILICLLYKCFYENLTTVNYPNHVISVCKRDIQDIKEIKYSCLSKRIKLTGSLIDLSKLERLTLSGIGEPEEIELDGLSSLQYLKLTVDSVKRFSAKNLPSLNHFTLESKKLNKSLSNEIFRSLSYIKELEINGVLSDINLDELVNLEKLSLSGKMNNSKRFNVELFKNICDNLQELSINIENMEDKSISKLFYGLNFLNLVKLDIKYSKITKLEKEMFDGFPMLKFLSITENDELRIIDSDSFSSLTNLVQMDLSLNIIESINQRQFSGLINLETLNLSRNQIKCIEENSFLNFKNLELIYNNLSILNPKSLMGLENLKYLNLSNNKLRYFDACILDYMGNIEKFDLFGNFIMNLNEISRRCKDSKIIFNI